MLQRISGIILMVLGGGSCLVINSIRQKHPDFFGHPMVYYFLGAALFFLGFQLYRLSLRAKFDADIHAEEKRRADLIAHGERIDVDLSTCIIKEHHYSEEQEPKRYRVRVYEYYEPQKKLTVQQAVIVFGHVCQGKKRMFNSPVISKERATLQMMMELKKTTWLYVDRHNPENYYFDLEFLRK